MKMSLLYVLFFELKIEYNVTQHFFNTFVVFFYDSALRNVCIIFSTLILAYTARVNKCVLWYILIWFNLKYQIEYCNCKMPPVYWACRCYAYVY